MSDKLYIVIPAYNESANIKTLIENWYPIIERYDSNGESRLVIIDDGSRDNTLDLIREAEKDPSPSQRIN